MQTDLNDINNIKAFALIVPILNAGEHVDRFLAALEQQTIKPSRFVVLDSESSDGSAEKFRAAGASVVSISRATFNHGGTRMRGLDCIGDMKIAVFMTQDALLADDRSLERLLHGFLDPTVDVTYGRQLPNPGAGGIESFARLHNYPPESQLRSIMDKDRYGFRVCFCSNSFAAYRVDRLKAIGGFPGDTIFGEDAIAVSHLLLSGGKIQYTANATVYHSHSYTHLQEFRRYFDIGVMHAQQAGLMMRFGSVESEGRRFVVAELSHLLRQQPAQIPSAILRTGMKYLGYRLGRSEAKLPIGLKRRLGMHRSFWSRTLADA